MTLGETLNRQPQTKTLNKPTLAQRTILNLLEGGEDFVIVHGAYAADVLSLQAQGLITNKYNGEGQFEVRLKGIKLEP